jgi:DNA replication protein DnaC
MDTAREWVEDNQDYDVLIDDVGTEPLMKSWGQEAELFPYLLEKRMQLCRRTHLTSNLGILDIKRRYGERVVDRFVQVFKMETMKAKKSRRVLKPWKRGENGNGVT